MRQSYNKQYANPSTTRILRAPGQLTLSRGPKRHAVEYHARITCASTRATTVGPQRSNGKGLTPETFDPTPAHVNSKP